MPYVYENHEVEGELADLGIAPAIIAGVTAVVSALASSGSVRTFFTGESYNAFLNYYNDVAEKDCGLQRGTDPKTVLGYILQAGIVPIYCSDSVGTRDDIISAFSKLGWTGKTWWNRYAKGGGQYAHYYGATFKLSDAPQALIDKAMRDCGGSLATRTESTIRFLTDAKHHMKSYGGTADKNNPATFEPLALLSIPLSAASCSAYRGGSSSGGGDSQIVPMRDQPTPAGKSWYKNPLVWVGIGGGTLVLTLSGYLLYTVLRKR